MLSLKKNINHRFQEAFPVVSSFSIFDLLAVPPPDDTSFRCFRSSEVKILAAHYYSTQTDKEKLHAEWNNFKFELVKWKSKEEFKTATTTTTPTEWVLHRLIARKEAYSQVYPMLYKIAQLCTTMLVSNAWPERVSTLWRVKTCVQSRMKNDLLEAFMHVFINGPAVSSKEGSKIIDRAVKRWSQVRRRKLPNVQCASRMNDSNMTSTSDAQVHWIFLCAWSQFTGVLTGVFIYIFRTKLTPTNLLTCITGICLLAISLMYRNKLVSKMMWLTVLIMRQKVPRLKS